MSWFKRNLFFLIGSVVALGLLGASGFYLYSKLKLNNDNLEKLNVAYKELDRLTTNNLGVINTSTGKTDNIKLAKEQQQQLLALIEKVREHFKPIPPIPNSPNVTSEIFVNALSQTIDQLQKSAAAAKVALPPKYNFSFEAELPQFRFAPGSLGPLAAQLGEVKAICDVLFEARVNRLDPLRRVRVADFDREGQSDYLDEAPVTNDLAVLIPYEVTFYCFSSELGGVLSGFASAPYGFIVKTVSLEPAASTTISPETGGSAPAAYVAPAYVPQAPPPSSGGDDNFVEIFTRNYGRPPTPQEIAQNSRATSRSAPRPVFRPAPPPPTAATVPVAPKTGSRVAPNEKQLKVTVTLDIVKLLPRK